MTGRLPRAEDPAGALLSALRSPWPTLRTEARRIIAAALDDACTYTAAATRLGVSERSLRRLRAELDGPAKRPEKKAKSRRRLAGKDIDAGL